MRLVGAVVLTMLVSGCGVGSAAGGPAPRTTPAVTTAPVTLTTATAPRPTTTASITTTAPSTTTTAHPTTTTTVAAPTTTTTASTTTTSLPPTTAPPLPAAALAPGDEGAEVAELQKWLTAALLYRGDVTAVFDEPTAAAVVAFHKQLDVERSAEWAADDWSRLAGFSGPVLPERSGEPDRLEIDHTRQLLYVVDDGLVTAIIPVSTGNGEWFVNYTGSWVRARTPRGDFALYMHRTGWHESYLGWMYRPWYFYGGYALHGSTSVPPWPASHGCVRIPVWEADYLESRLFMGMPVHVWD